LGDTHVHEPYIRALLGTAPHFCEVVALKLRTVPSPPRPSALPLGEGLFECGSGELAPVQGYLDHEKQRPPQDPTVGIGLGPYGGPGGGLFVMSEVRL